MEIPVVSPKELGTILRVHFDRDEPLFISGAPGIGKSRIVEQVTMETFNVRPTLFVGSIRQPTDLMGFPQPKWDADRESGEMLWLPPSNKDIVRKPPGVFFADELTSAPMLVQSALLQVLGDERRVGGLYIEPGVGRVAAGNRPEDRAGAGRLISALSDRMTIVELQPKLSDWMEWAFKSNLSEHVIGYIKFMDSTKHKCLSDWDANRTINATPRSWEKVSRLLPHLPESVRQKATGGVVGLGHAAGLEGFIALRDRLPDPDALLKKPQDFEPFDLRKPEGVQLSFALCTALAMRVKKTNVPAIFKLAEKFQPEFGMCLVQDAISVDNEAITNSLDYQKWHVNHPEMYR